MHLAHRLRSFTKPVSICVDSNPSLQGGGVNLYCSNKQCVREDGRGARSSSNIGIVLDDEDDEVDMSAFGGVTLDELLAQEG